MPRFALPHGVRIRSKWGYAFNGELEELMPINEERKSKVIRLKVKLGELQEQMDYLQLKEMQLQQGQDPKEEFDEWRKLERRNKIKRNYSLTKDEEKRMKDLRARF